MTNVDFSFNVNIFTNFSTCLHKSVFTNILLNFSFCIKNLYSDEFMKHHYKSVKQFAQKMVILLN